MLDLQQRCRRQCVLTKKMDEHARLQGATPASVGASTDEASRLRRAIQGDGSMVDAAALDPLLSLSSDTDAEDAPRPSSSSAASGALADASDDASSSDATGSSPKSSSSSTYRLELVLDEAESLLLDIGSGLLPP